MAESSDQKVGDQKAGGQKSGTFQENEMILSRAYFDHQGVNEITQLAAQLLENPVMLLDSTYQLAACEPDRALGFPSWDTILSTGYMDKDVVLHMGQYFMHMTNAQRHGAYFYEAVESNGRNFKKIVSGIVYENQILGGIAVAEYNRPLEEEDLAFCDYLCKVLGALLYKEAFLQKNYNQNFEQLFWDILSKNSLTTEVIEGRLEALGLLTEQVPYYLVSVDVLPAMKLNVDYLRTRLKELFPDFFTVLYQDALLIIGNVAHADYPQVLAELKQFLEIHFLYACISTPFHSLAQLRDQYALVRQGCTVGQKLATGTHLFEFKELNLHCLLQTAAEHFPIQHFLHPAIRILKVYDRENEADYRHTLITYLENNMNVLATAKQLFIHRNTLNYRLKKIEQLLNLSLDDKAVCINLLLADYYDALLSLEEGAGLASGLSPH